jgi:hypothetical protein
VKKLKMEYGSSVFVLPKDCLTAALRDAGEFNLKVLLTIAADESLRQDFDKCVASVCEQLDCTQTALEKAMKFWSLLIPGSPPPSPPCFCRRSPNWWKSTALSLWIRMILNAK